MTPEEALDYVTGMGISVDHPAIAVLRELISRAAPAVQCPNCGAIVHTSVWDMLGRPLDPETERLRHHHPHRPWSDEHQHVHEVRGSIVMHRHGPDGSFEIVR
jgi:hypothetical protein